jgi:predicted RNA-binding protein with PUA domain
MATRKAAPKPVEAPAKKAAPVKAAAKKAAPVTEDKVKGILNIDPDFMAQVVELREEGLKLETTPGKAILAYMKAVLPAKEKVKGDEAAKQKAIVSLRDDDAMSWGQIMVRVDMNLQKVQSLYEAATGVPTRGLRVGRGGRYPNEVEPGEKPARVLKKAAAKKAEPPAKTKVAATGKKPIGEMNLEELQGRLTGAKILVKRGDKTETIDVKTVKSLKDGVVEITNATNGATRTIKVEDIDKVGRQAAATKN